ncbi:hypothetical protein ACVGWT_00020, partial [Enterobacter hormaechei]
TCWWAGSFFYKRQAYAKINDPIQKALHKDGLLVRYITVSGSLCVSRIFRQNGPLLNINTLAGGFGMGVRMASATAIANPQRRV